MTLPVAIQPAPLSECQRRTAPLNKAGGDSYAEMARQSGLTRGTIRNRILRGWTPQEATGAQPRALGKTGRKTTASLSPDYARTYNQARRALAIAAGICTSCNTDRARPNRRKCHDCATLYR